jgi:hypothetical protein
MLDFNIFYSPAFYTGIFNQKIVAATNNIFYEAAPNFLGFLFLSLCPLTKDRFTYKA